MSDAPNIIRAQYCTNYNDVEKIEKKEDIKPLIFAESESSTSNAFSLLIKRPGLTAQQYWEAVIDEIEHSVKCQSRPRIPAIDYSIVLPPRLKARVERIIPYEYLETDKLIYIENELGADKIKADGMLFIKDEAEEQDEAQVKMIHLRDRNKYEHFSESKDSNIVRLQHEFERFHLKLDRPVGYTSVRVDNTNWLSKFVSKPRSERIIWNSKLYKKTNVWSEMSLDDQAEDLMDCSAKRFVDWLNNLGSKHDSGITVDKLKSLFSTKGDRTLLASIKTDPKEVKAIGKGIADIWHETDMAIETKYEAEILERARKVQKTKIFSAFGRTIPIKDRVWVKNASDVPIEPVYPRELLTREKLFKGIRHLRSTRALVEFYLKHKQLSRPEYLVAQGNFNEIEEEDAEASVPLYEKLGLKY